MPAVPFPVIQARLACDSASAPRTARSQSSSRSSMVAAAWWSQPWPTLEASAAVSGGRRLAHDRGSSGSAGAYLEPGDHAATIARAPIPLPWQAIRSLVRETVSRCRGKGGGVLAGRELSGG
jgi:hypothetical protein